MVTEVVRAKRVGPGVIGSLRIPIARSVCAALFSMTPVPCFSRIFSGKLTFAIRRSSSRGPDNHFYSRRKRIYRRGNWSERLELRRHVSVMKEILAVAAALAGVALAASVRQIMAALHHLAFK